LNNVLLIGMTNRIDMIDPALLRPGRFEVQVEISLPDENGRVQILNIHTSKMKKTGYLSPDVNIQDLAVKTKNFTGAEIEGLVKGAAAYAFNRQVNLKEDLRKVIDAKSLSVTASDFEAALMECKPQFGTTEAEDEMKRTMGGGVIPFSREFENVSAALFELAKESASSTNDAATLSLVSVLLCGEPGSGKTALAAKVAFESGFPLVKVISPDKFIGMSEQTKSSAIADAFDQAYKSEKSLILLEDIERLIDYSKIGPRFSNQVLQTLLILIRKPPPKKGRRLFIIGTTSVKELMEPMDLVSVFNLVLYIPQVQTFDEVHRIVKSYVADDTPEQTVQEVARACPTPISVKKLLLALDMAQKDGRLEKMKFQEFLALG
jgi:vesicle-fusing ATPase